MSRPTDVTTATTRAPGTPPGQRRAPRPPAPGRKAPGRPRPPAAPGAPPPPAARAPAAAPARRGPGTRPSRPRASAPPQGRGGAATGAALPSRTSFVLLVVGLLGGGLLCLLVINTVLDTGSYQISHLQQQNSVLTQREQSLQARIAAQESPSELARRARQLGMVEPSLLHFIDLHKGHIDSEPTRVPGVPAVPGYTP